MRKSKAVCLFMIAAATILLISGCSCDRDKSLSRIKQAGHIRIALSAGYSPFSFYNDKKELVGFDIDVAREVAKRLGVDLKIIDTPWEGIINGLNAQRYDGILAVGTTFERDAVSIGAKNIRRYPNDDEALLGLHQGEVDAVITDEIVGMYMAMKKKLRIKSLGGPLGEEQIAAAFRKEDKALLAEVNHALQAMQKDGAMRRLMEKMGREGY
jgi:polar amino acid transport system substrate-binding protein